MDYSDILMETNKCMCYLLLAKYLKRAEKLRVQFGVKNPCLLLHPRCRFDHKNCLCFFFQCDGKNVLLCSIVITLIINLTLF